MLVELIRENDGDECEMLHLSQGPSTHITLTGGSMLTKIGSIDAYENSIDTVQTWLICDTRLDKYDCFVM